jgi:hypothetical protein
VAVYVKKNKGRLPRSNSEAIRILEREALNGDPYAAKWIAYQYECSSEAIDLPNALRWFSLSVKNSEKLGLPESAQLPIKERKNRLEILEKTFR